MRVFIKICFMLLPLSLFISSASALEQSDREAINEVIEKYTHSWNENQCKGFGDDFTEDADFVNIFGMHFVGKAQIEERHLKIMQSFLKDSKLEITETRLREVQPDLVIALVKWKLNQTNQNSNIREGIFTQVFINSDKKWLITASQNTLIQNKQ